MCIRDSPAPASQHAPHPPPLLAALPFINLSDDAQQRYFAAGFTEDVIRELSRFRAVQIMAAHSSFGAADVGGTPREIGERLGVRYLLTGSVRRTVQLLRIGAELIDASDGHVLWSHHYDPVSYTHLTAAIRTAGPLRNPVGWSTRPTRPTRKVGLLSVSKPIQRALVSACRAKSICARPLTR